MSLKALLADEQTRIEAITDWLDQQDHETRLAETRGLGRSEQRRLYELAADAPALDLEFFVPPDRADRQEVIHHGTNTLPLPRKHKQFQKRFCRPEGRTDRLYGYNEAASRWLIGPGYFVTIFTAPTPEWMPRGAVVVDYFQVPDSPVAEGWPEVKQNHQGLQRLVYYHTRDFMRRVSRHVSIGAAYKEEKPLGHFFTLVREDPA